MPELPEVETSRRGIEPHILNQQVCDVIIRQKKLRWPIPSALKKYLTGQVIQHVERRGKYILLRTQAGTVILHLGMSGSLRILDKDAPPKKHDHFDLIFQHALLRLHDPRRFGAVLWTKADPLKHKLICNLGPEPLNDTFNAEYLYHVSRKRKVAIKILLMNSHIVVGVGNIYANESLFSAGINPKRRADKISLTRYKVLVSCVKDILERAIEQGGTTLKDFTQQDGKPGYFQQTLQVYGRTGLPCTACKKPVSLFKQGQRSTFYCTHCQN